MAFMKNPGKAPEKPKEEVWADTPSDVIHLTDATFHEFVKVILPVSIVFSFKYLFLLYRYADY